MSDASPLHHPIITAPTPSLPPPPRQYHPLTCHHPPPPHHHHLIPYHAPDAWFARLQWKKGRTHGRRCVQLCYLVFSATRVCAYVCAVVCACMKGWVCFAVPRHCGSANSLISAAPLCACVCTRVCVYESLCMCAYMLVSPLHFVSISQVGNKRFCKFEKMGYGRTDGRTDRPTDRPTDGPIDRQTDRQTHLKTS